MNDQQKRTNTGGKLLSSYVAEVTNVENPDNLYLAQVRLVGLWDYLPIDVLPWAEFILPLGSKPEAGHAVPVEVKDQVWVDFPRNGDTRYPRILGAVYQAPEMVSNLPIEITGEGFEQKRCNDEPVAPTYSPKDDIYKRFGLMEHKTHEGGWCITHLGTGSAIEINKDGQIIVHCEKDSFRSSDNLLEQTKGNITINVGGDAVINAKGSTAVKAGKDATIEAKGNATLKAGNTATIDSSKLNFKSGADIVFEAAGKFMVKARLADFKLG